MISQTILINNIIWIMNQIEMLIKCSHTYAMSLNWITIFPALSPHRKFCERFVTGVPGTSKLGSVRGSYLLFPNRSLPTCTGYLVYSNEFVVLSPFSHSFVIFFLYDCNLWRHVDISIKRLLFKWCSQIRNTRLNLNDFYKLQIACQIVNFDYCVWFGALSRRMPTRS